MKLRMCDIKRGDLVLGDLNYPGDLNIRMCIDSRRASYSTHVKWYVCDFDFVFGCEYCSDTFVDTLFKLLARL